MEPAPDFVIVRTAKSNFWSSSSRDEIKRLDRALTAADVQNMLSIVLPQMLPVLRGQLTDGSAPSQLRDVGELRMLA
jgi:hypothetical protein